MKTLFILNDAPYGSERSYNGLRLAGSPYRQSPWGGFDQITERERGMRRFFGPDFQSAGSAEERAGGAT